MGKKEKKLSFKSFKEFKEYYFPNDREDDDINPYENPFEYGRKLAREALRAVSPPSQIRETKDHSIG
jgi:hypothetical protein